MGTIKSARELLARKLFDLDVKNEFQDISLWEQLDNDERNKYRKESDSYFEMKATEETEDIPCDILELMKQTESQINTINK